MVSRIGGNQPRAGIAGLHNPDCHNGGQTSSGPTQDAGDDVLRSKWTGSTNLGVTSSNPSSSQSGTQLIGDFNVEYLMTNDGKLRLKGFSQSNDRNLTQLNQAQTTQGAGLAYREEFNTLSEFFTKVGNLFRGKAKQRVVE